MMDPPTTALSAGGWRKKEVYAPTNKANPLLFALALAFVIGYNIGQTETAPLMASHLFTAITSAVGGVGPRDVTSSELLGRYAIQRRKMELELMEEFGDWYGQIFDPVRLEGVFASGMASRDRLVRRIMIKVAEARVAEMTTKTATGSTDKDPKLASTFIWATAGDSAAAGHGNLFDQSYTAVMGRSVHEAFASLGVDFQSKNYAHGGYTSGPELALCMEAVYGPDLDVLAYDFSLTEGADSVHHAALWGDRAGVHATAPILFLMGSRQERQWTEFLRHEGMGLGAILMDRNGIQDIRQRLPDSSQVENPEDELPDALRYYRCADTIEGVKRCNDMLRFNLCEAKVLGELCTLHKYKTDETCEGNVRFQETWHPGWKDHNLKGRLLGYFVLDALEEALVQLDEYRSPEPGAEVALDDRSWTGILDYLYAETGADVATFLQSTPSFDSWPSEDDKNTLLEVGPSILFRKPAICHTALLPAQTRYDGIMTTSGKRMDPKYGFQEGDRKQLIAPPDDGILPLAYDANDRQTCPALEIDHKDFFLVKEGWGFLGQIVPSQAELQAFDRGARKEGLVMVCLKICPNNRCPDASVGFGLIKRNRGKLFITIDGKPVTAIKKLEGCHFMAGEHGLKWSGQAGTGAHDIRFRITDPALEPLELTISSIVVF